jgi:hypothetical protein
MDFISHVNAIWWQIKTYERTRQEISSSSKLIVGGRGTKASLERARGRRISSGVLDSVLSPRGNLLLRKRTIKERT